MTTLTLEVDDWMKIKKHVVNDYGAKTALISWALQRELGFTVRVHHEWVDSDKFSSGNKTSIKLDFVDEPSYTFFTLKYMNNDNNLL
jgi:hypothetical protein